MKITVPRSDWSELHESCTQVRGHIETLEAANSAEDIYTNAKRVEEANKPLHEKLTYFARSMTKDLSEEQRTLNELLDHDVLEVYFHFRVYLDTLLRKSQKGLSDVVQDTRIGVIATFFGIQGALDSLQFWVNGERLVASPVDLSCFFSRRERFFGEAFDNNLERPVRINVQQGLTASMHEATISTLIFNCCRNAWKHGNAKNLSISAFCEGDQVVIEVADDGKGVNEGIVDRIFEAGFSGGRGKGLGIADARERVQGFGGIIECIPHGGAGRGAKFRITLKKTGGE